MQGSHTMKTAVLCGIALTSTVTAFAQAPVAPPHTMTLTGCVSGGTKSRPITLLNALVLPIGAATPTPPAAVPDAARAETATGTSGSLSTAGTARGTAPAGSSASSITGYRLSGTDMTSWIGRRVEIVGTLVSSPTASSTAPVGTTGTLGKTDTLPIPEFR